MTDTKTAKEVEIKHPEVQVGAIFVETWGYGQTNVDYYEVVSRTAKSVVIKHLKQGFIEQRGAYGDKVVPLPGQYTERSWGRGGGEKGQRKLLQTATWSGTNEPYLNMSSYSSAHLWSGQPNYQTDTSFGH